MPCPGADRYKLRAEVRILTEDGICKGRVTDMSVSGARIEDSGPPPPEGSVLKLGFALHAEGLPIPIRADVIRHTETGGFAVSFRDLDFRTEVILSALLPQIGIDVGPALSPDSQHLQLALPRALHQAISERAERDELSLEDWVQGVLERAIAASDG